MESGFSFTRLDDGSDIESFVHVSKCAADTLQEAARCLREFDEKYNALDMLSRAILAAVAAGDTNKKIAGRHEISTRTVEDRRSKMYRAFDVLNAVQLGCVHGKISAYREILQAFDKSSSLESPTDSPDQDITTDTSAL